MKIYLAGTSVVDPKTDTQLQKLFAQGHKLHSYFHCENGFESKWFEENIKNKVDLFIDSGAYSAKTQKVEIDVYAYMQFLEKYKDYISIYANLDVINDAKKTLPGIRDNAGKGQETIIDRATTQK